MNEEVGSAAQQQAPHHHFQRVSDILIRHQQRPGALLPILHDIQRELGFVPPAAVAQIASVLRQSRADVHGVISFYHYFRTTPPGRHVLQVCRAEACQARGGRALEKHIKQTLGVDYHGTTQDGEITLEPVYCLGNCACGPTLQVDDEMVGQVTNTVFDRLLDTLTTVAVEIK